MTLNTLQLKKNADRRLRLGHLWVYSNEVDTAKTPLKNFSVGDEVIVVAHDKTPLGVAYINPHSLITARLFTHDIHERLDMSFLTKRIKHALQLRTRLFKKPFFRCVFGEGDGLPGIIADRFDDTLSVQINTAGMDAKTQTIIHAFTESIPSLQSILLRNDSNARKQEGLETYIKAGLGSPSEKVFLEENDTRFYAPLWSGQKTGWFYDHRSNRARLKDYVSQLRVLDVFSYLGGFAIQAAKFGANEVTCIDASALSKSGIQENAELNGVSEKIQVITDDAFAALKNLSRAKDFYDVIILDPPAFVKKQKDLKEGLLAYQRINEAALKCLKPEGILISCSCSMHVSAGDLLQAIRRANLRTRYELQILEVGHQSMDHPIHFAIPETDYLKMIILHRAR